MTLQVEDAKLAVIGLGYVGLPLAAAFGQTLPVLGFDINARRIAELRCGLDRTREVGAEELAASEHLELTDDPRRLADCNVYIVTVPTPIDRFRRPDLGPLKRASKSIGGTLKPGDVVIYESTVYPGATEEVCVAILERESGLVFNRDFYAGYSPERINPGDKAHRIHEIRKITSGSTPETAQFVDALYRRIITAGTFMASSIRVAEAAKVIENTQRDVNIALVNELAVLFHRLEIDTEEVLAAAGTKWNFLPFRPGLVGGHCIGVDPYYLTHKAQEVGHHPEIILVGRRLNDHMAFWVAERILKLLIRRSIQVVNSRILVMGLAFKENCPDIRNTQVIDLVRELESFKANVDVYDPWVDAQEAMEEYSIEMLGELNPGRYDAVIIAVAHDEFRELGIDAIRKLGKAESLLFDAKYLFAAHETDARL